MKLVGEDEGGKPSEVSLQPLAPAPELFVLSAEPPHFPLAKLQLPASLTF